jgi:hypothetical protein
LTVSLRRDGSYCGCLSCRPLSVQFKPLRPGCARYHDAEPDLPYLAWHDDAETRHKRGEKQIQCPACCLFVWECLFHHLPTEVKTHLGGNHWSVRSGDPAPNPKYKGSTS